MSLPGQLDALLATVSDEAGGLSPWGQASAESPEGSPTSSALLSRLLPPAYLHDDAADAAYARTRHPQLVAQRRQALDTLAKLAAGDTATAEELEIACSALNDLRLVLGTALEVTDDPPEPDERDPSYPQWVCYAYLSALQGEVVDALSGGLPPPRLGADDEVPADPWGEPPGDLRWDGTTAPSA